jgi:MOSC domain-containing protein YiiM
MHIVSVNVGTPRTVEWRGKLVETGIFKAPIDSAVMVRALNLDGDAQADLSVHGGTEKAVYAYPSEYYPYWQDQLNEALSWGAFGENLTVTGLDEDTLYIGDRLRVGEAELVVTQPRLPCYKLGVRFGRADMVKIFLASRRTGFYFAVAREGLVQAGDTIEVLERDQHAVSIADITRVYAFDKHDIATMRRIVAVPTLPAGWRDYFAEHIAAA